VNNEFDIHTKFYGRNKEKENKEGTKKNGSTSTVLKSK